MIVHFTSMWQVFAASVAIGLLVYAIAGLLALAYLAWRAR
jgi:hypothetical protein